MSIKKFRERKSSTFATLKKEAEKESSNSYKNNDERFWSLQTDKSKNGNAVIRFLYPPIPDEDDADIPQPWVSFHTHGFKGPGGWFIENCPTSIGKDCPVCDYNTEEWDENDEISKTNVRQRKRKLNYISNIYVVKDPANPENEGKVFLFKYGKQIFNMINDKLHPDEELGEEEINVFDPEDGCNFSIHLMMENNFPTYKKSKFGNPSPIAKTDKKIDEICSKTYELEEFIAEDKFKSYNELQGKFEKVMKGSARVNSPSGSTQKTKQAPQEKVKEYEDPGGEISTDEIDDLLDEFDD